jgi:hypothetical protein
MRLLRGLPTARLAGRQGGTGLARIAARHFAGAEGSGGIARLADGRYGAAHASRDSTAAGRDRARAVASPADVVHHAVPTTLDSVMAFFTATALGIRVALASPIRRFCELCSTPPTVDPIGTPSSSRSRSDSTLEESRFELSVPLEVRQSLWRNNLRHRGA